MEAFDRHVECCAKFQSIRQTVNFRKDSVGSFEGNLANFETLVRQLKLFEAVYYYTSRLRRSIVGKRSSSGILPSRSSRISWNDISGFLYISQTTRCFLLSTTRLSIFVSFFLIHSFWCGFKLLVTSWLVRNKRNSQKWKYFYMFKI